MPLQYVYSESSSQVMDHLDYVLASPTSSASTSNTTLWISLLSGDFIWPSVSVLTNNETLLIMPPQQSGNIQLFLQLATGFCECQPSVRKCLQIWNFDAVCHFCCSCTMCNISYLHKDQNSLARCCNFCQCLWKYKLSWRGQNNHQFHDEEVCWR